jgi:hypothetical protein
LTVSFLIILGIIVSLSYGLDTASAQENNTADFGITVETDEKLIADLTPMLPYLGIAAVGIIVAIFLVIKKLGSNDDDLEDDFEEDSEEPLFENPEFQEIKTDAEADDANALDPEVLIQHKIRMISKLQENKIGENEKLEKIKKDLKDYGTFTKEDNDYLEEQFAEYEKIANPED